MMSPRIDLPCRPRSVKGPFDRERAPGSASFASSRLDISNDLFPVPWTSGVPAPSESGAEARPECGAALAQERAKRKAIDMTRFGLPLFIAVALELNGCGPGWSAPQNIETERTPPGGVFYYFGPKVAAAGTVFGTATAIWTAENTSFHASHLGTSWGAPAAFADHRDSRRAHAVAAGVDGSAVAVFTTNTGLQSVRFAGGAWGAAVPLGEGGGWPAISADRDGNMIAVWRTATHVRAARYLVAGGWQPTETLGADATSIMSTDVSVSPAGYAIAAWCETRSGGASFIVANRFVPTSGWTGATDLGSVPACLHLAGSWAEFSADPTTVDTAIDELNVPAVVWTNGTVQVQRYARHLDGTSSWTAPLALSAGTDDTNPLIAVNRDGDAIAAWQTANGDFNEVRANRYSAEFDRWGGTTLISSAISRPPQLAVGIDSAQHGMVGYLEGGQTVTMRPYDGASFGTPQAISQPGSYEFDMTMTADGQASAAWARANIDVFTATFTP
jgi:hypothetical protein